MTKETMYDVKISANDLEHLAPARSSACLVGHQVLLQYLTRPNGAFWALMPLSDDSTSTERPCVGYPDCDGDLPGEEHSTGCLAAHNLAERAMSAFLQADHLRPEEAGRSRKAVDAVIRLVQQDSNARWDKALRDHLGPAISEQAIEWARTRIEAADADAEVPKHMAACEKQPLAKLKAPVSEDYHFEDGAIMDALVGTTYLKGEVERFLRHATTGTKWSLYRAVAKLIAARAGKEQYNG